MIAQGKAFRLWGTSIFLMGFLCQCVDSKREESFDVQLVEPNTIAWNGSPAITEDICKGSHELCPFTGEHHVNAQCEDNRCSLICIDGFSDCNAATIDSCETDTKSDPNNCGLCGRSCFGGACVNGACSLVRVSIDSFGVQGNGNCSEPSISKDGRFVTYQSVSTNLVEHDQNQSEDVFVHDRKTGTTTRVSLSSTGAEAPRPSFHAGISANGRFVSFLSEAPELFDGGEKHMSGLFVHDQDTGMTTLASVDNTGRIVGDVDSFTVISMSADGRLIVFNTPWRLSEADTDENNDVFARDMEENTTLLVSSKPENPAGEFGGSEARVSPEGDMVAFYGCNLEPGGCRIFLWERDLNTTRAAPLNWEGSEHSKPFGLSSHGRYLVFEPQIGGFPGVSVFDFWTGLTASVSIDSFGRNMTDARAPSISHDGNIISFLAATVTSETLNVYARDMKKSKTYLLSQSASGAVGNGHSGGVYGTPQVSGDGRWVVFSSAADNLVPGDTNGMDDIFVAGVPQ